MKRLLVLGVLILAFFTTLAQTCECNIDNRWGKLTAYINSKPKITICGSTFNIDKGQQFGLNGSYECGGSCNTIFTVVLTNAETGGVIETYQHFEFTWLYKFYKAGKYKLVIIPGCKVVKCTGCTFYFKVQ